MQHVRKVLVLAQTRERVVDEAQKPYALVPYDIFCKYVRGVSVKIR